METTVRGNTHSNSGIPNGNDGALHKASSSAHAAVDSIAVAADEVARKAKPAIERVAAMAHKAVDKAAGAAAPAAEWLADGSECMVTAQKKLVGDARSYVSANPLKSIGIAVAAGLLLSRFIR
jgi:ElaB/YqjD/DUF883 family membrane-anchored ribosome-binding protein